MSERSQRSAAASRGSRAHSSSQLRRRAGIRIRDIDDPDVEAEITVLGSDGSVQNSLVWSQRRAAQAASASGNSRAAASEASSLPSASALYEVKWDADLYGELSNEQRAPVVLASEGRVMLLIEDSDGGGGGGSSSGGGRHYHFVELAALQARDGSEGLAARCTCNNVGKLAGVMMQGGGIVALSSVDGAVIVMVELAGGAAAVRCPGEDEDDWAVVVNWDDPTKPASCLP
ncbi:hypothetical protein C2E20_6790 [Micractinium conductrix]|uniref:Uncharacterized protein n=1 Tax=Micractinium conductrix TaxID=554055 RepID=A0A2P6V6K1_9CHLO|nr:hypothetical protein C2E20_6790 [Micractinium conductrix]|eukprot:PSC69714.1 hypothetical protein C2E20_6790 [Micractinium conductrix]